MAEKFLLPNPALKGAEHEKWKAMVDSVIEFISASRAMLQVLNERIKENDKLRDDNKKKVEEEKVKMQFYEEFLNTKLITKSERALNCSNVNEENENINNIKKKEETLSMDDRINDSILRGQEKKFRSKIPRTKSLVCERTKTSRVERTFNEGAPLGKRCRSRNTEVGYSTIHQKSKTPKGDGIS